MYIDKLGNKRFKIGLHIHTSLSDGVVSPEISAQEYKSAGYDAIAFTDHWHYGEEKEIEGLKIFSGCEYNLGFADSIEGVVHIVGIGMVYAPDLYHDASLQETVDKINKTGGIAILAHPAWSLNSPEQIASIRGLAATEIFNTVSGEFDNDRAYSGAFVDLLANKGVTLPLIASDDVHLYTTDRAKAFIMVSCEELTIENVKSAILSGNFYASTGPELLTSFHEGKLTINCSECIKISILSNSVAGKVIRGEELTHFEYYPGKYIKWLRVEITDKNGDMAWSNIYLTSI